MGIRIMTHKGRAASAAEWTDHLDGIEDAGFAGLMVSDHLGGMDPPAALAHAAAVTERIALGTNVLNIDFWHPVLLARAAATVDVLSGGRMMLGLGAGWNRPEYEAAGIGFDPAPARIARMGEAARILKALFAGEEVDHDGEHYRVVRHTLEPTPPQGAGLPIMIGGNGDRVLRQAAEIADVVGLTGFSASARGAQITHFGLEGFADRIDFVRRRAGGRDLDFNVLVQRLELTEDAERRAAEIAADDSRVALGPDASTILESPFMLIGTEDEITAKLAGIHEEFGVDSYSVFGARTPEIDHLVARLASA